MNIRPQTKWGAGALLAALAIIATPLQTVAASTRTEIKKLVVEEALATNVPPSLAMALAKVESDFQARAISPKGARGVMQIMPANAHNEFGVEADELWNARLNIQLGIDFLERLIVRYDGRWDLALSHYNGGSVAGNSLNARVLPSTQKYVQTVLQWQRRYANQSTVWQVYRAEKDGWIPSRTRAFDGRSIVSSRWSDTKSRTQRQVLTTPGWATGPIDGKYYAEDKNEDDVVWKLNLEVANNEVSASLVFEECDNCINGGDRSTPIQCGSTKLDTKNEFELWCEVTIDEGMSGAGDDARSSSYYHRKLWGDLREVNLWDTGLAGGAKFKIINHSELAKFNRFKADTGIHKTAAYLDKNGSVGVTQMADTGQNNRPKFRTLDDFSPELERRRAKARLTLDDFAKGWYGT